jgi:hypothetical protein
MLLRALADRISTMTHDRLPAQAIGVATQGVSDTSGVVLAAACDEITAAIRSRAYA